MKFDIKFKSIDHSQSLVDYAQERLTAKLEKFEIRPTMIHITFSQERHEQVTHIYIKGMNSSFKAHASADSLHVSLDMCLKKLKKQMEKEKSKIKHHHHYEHSQEAQLEQMVKKEEKNKHAS